MNKFSCRVGVATALLFSFRLLHATQINTFNGLQIGADDGSFSLRLRALIQVDANFYQSDKQHLASGGFVRRAQLGVTGNLHEWNYKVVYDNARQINPLVDAKVFRWVGPGRIWIGQFKVFEGLEEITKDEDTLFMERSYVDEIVPGHQVGLAYNGATNRYGYAATVYNRRDSAEGPRAVDVGYGGVVRGYFLPINQKNLVTHLGASYAHESTQAEGVRMRVKPLGRDDTYSNGDDTFKFDVYDRQGEKVEVSRGILEGLVINGPLTLQAEYVSGAATTDTKPDDEFFAWYAMAGYVLTGENHLYDTKKGRPQGIKPQRAAGAVEIVARYQQATRKSVSNGVLDAQEYGVTYYANENVRFMVNYSLAQNKFNGDSPQLLAMRTQISF